MAAQDSVLMKHVAPSLGCAVAFMLFSSPFKAVMQVRQARALGSLNPLPLVAMWANCLAWLVYAFMTLDIYVLISNIPGLLLSAFMTFTCYGYADEKVRSTMLHGVVIFAAIMVCSGTAVSFGPWDHTMAVNIWGCTTVFILVIFYSAPLSALAEVFRTRSSATLHLPFAVMNTINGMLWTLYGLALGDSFIYGPNMVGAVFGAIQVVLCTIYPGKTVERENGASPGDLDSELAGMLCESGKTRGR